MKTSKLADKELLTKLVKECSTLSEILLRVGLTATSGNYRTLNNYFILYGISFESRPISKKGSQRRYTDEECFKENSTIARHHLKKRLLDDNLVPNECHICKLGNTWNGIELVLQLEHKNGINNDNRLENLALICPNCHSQSETYAAKNKVFKKEL